VADSAASDIVIVAGGLGLAPIRPAIYHVLNHRARYGRLVLLVGSRNPEDLLFRAELDEWCEHQELDVAVNVGHVRKELEHWREQRLDITVTVDCADVSWRGNVGGLAKLIPQATFDPHNTVAMLCGPEVLMRHAANTLVDVGVPAGRIHLAMERNMKCAIGLCGHCQFGPTFICKDGPVMSYEMIERLLVPREL
jgi:NAD(P)H-flavin reductase